MRDRSNLNCRKCKVSPANPRLAARSDYRCNECVNADNAAYRRRRKDAGNPVVRRDASWAGRKARHWDRYATDPEYRQKYQARVYTRRAVYEGKLERKPCEVCGDPRSEAHHDDYTKVLDVRWLCRIHHMRVHADLNRLKRAKAA